MPRQHITRRKAVAVAAAILLLALLLAACGGGGSGSTSSASSTKANATGASGRGQFAARAAALRTCLKKAGIALPERKPGKSGSQRPGGPFGGGGAGGGFQLPTGVSREKLQAALKKCGGGAGFGGAARGLGGARSTQQLTKFAACMRTNGVKLPAPNASGKGPIFDTKGIDTTSAAFKAADAKCMKELRPAGAEAGAPGGRAPGGGEPGSGGEPGAPPA
jgi:hypothetical protein